MCARFTLKRPRQDLENLFNIKLALDLEPRPTIAPSQQILVIRQEAPGRRPALLQWGLVPHWAQSLSDRKPIINARCESIATKPSFRDAFRYRRCLIPADGFYEWKTEGKTKLPFLIERTDRQLLAFAGIWDHWQNPDGTEIESCAIITTPPNATVSPIHNRMPAILPPDHWAPWLDPQTPIPNLASMLVPAPPETLIAHPLEKPPTKKPSRPPTSPRTEKTPAQFNLFEQH